MKRIEPAATWDDLALPADQLRALRDIAVRVTPRTPGLSVLFAGPSGTGKTLAAEVLARELAMPLYRIDLSQVVSKYIGETEKNLHRVFEAADPGDSILLFDEADALFGKRTDVKDSHDRYANVETSHLLQRIEAHHGLVILVTNLKRRVDETLRRRLLSVVEFPP